MAFLRILHRLHGVLVRARDEEGQALVEYALLLSLIAIAAVAAVDTFGQNLSTMYQSILDAIP